ncbi:unnamed protein product [Blepharisma stoltei]|uniref:Uncharacterized protein n=1 Tax=Blepharisma stoltei TaxID=1481888 RepID=A0AAU9J1Z8_9CILI|nr:unnamed protein product [Blepharisma stoltei]
MSNPNALFSYLASLLLDISLKLSKPLNNTFLNDLSPIDQKALLIHQFEDGSKWEISISSGTTIHIERVEEKSTQANSTQNHSLICDTIETFPDEFLLTHQSEDFITDGFEIPIGDLDPLEATWKRDDLYIDAEFSDVPDSLFSISETPGSEGQPLLPQPSVWKWRNGSLSTEEAINYM